MKENTFKKFNKRTVAVLTALVLIVNILPQFSFFDNVINNIEAGAASLSMSEIKSRFDNKMNSDSLGWVVSEDMIVTKTNENMWHDTSDMKSRYIDAEGMKSEQKASADSIGYRIDINENDVWNYVKTDNAKSVYDCSYSGATDTVPNNTDDSNIYYIIKHDDALSGYYRQYYISTADQLATLLYHYQTDFDSSLIAEDNESVDNSSVNKVSIVLLNSIDLGGSDTDSNYWLGYKNRSVNLEIDGQGYSIYNGYFKSENNYFLNVDYKFAIHDLTFSNMYLARAGGMFGAARYAYFNNVNWQHCLAAGDSSIETTNSIVFAQSYLFVYLKDCTIDNSYIAGSSHCALFASYNGGMAYSESRSYIGDDALTEYIGKTDVRSTNSDKQLKGFYYTSVPDNIEDAERAWNGLGKTEDDGNTYWLATIYPSIYENCATVNSTVYDAGINHSGTFVSCMQSAIIFKNCFSNCTIYANSQLGVFLGEVIGSGDGFYYPYDGDKTFVNAYFENCYTSGAIEGSTKIGGFVGGIFDDVRAYAWENSNALAAGKPTKNRGKLVFRNCYSTSSVGMQYTGTNVGGFVGVVLGNIQGDTEIFGSDVRQHVFENCYAAGEVGGITTDVSAAVSNTNTIGGFIGTYVNYSDEVAGMTYESASAYKPYVSAVNSEETNNTVKLINCYYDKQTTAMRERDIGNVTTYSTKTISLFGTLDGLYGAYTKNSKVKRVLGLTDTVNMKGDVWDNSMSDYYPQLKTLTVYPGDDTPTDLIEKMKYERQLKYYNYSLASTAAVLLDHYDNNLDEYGNLELADSLVYDTVRDITSKFEFTTDYGNSVAWDNNAERNRESGFFDKIGSDGKGFKVSYVDSEGRTQEKEHNPNVMKIVQDNTDEDKYKCSEFAPGKQWVTVTTGSGDKAGQRDLRLLPTAYLNAGGVLEINVVPDDNDVSKVLRNEVKLDGTLLSGFNHYSGVAYALTDTTRMGNDDIYNAQAVSKYNADDTDSFVLHGDYLLTGNSTAVGLNGDGKMYNQEFAVTDQENNSSSGKTMIKVFNTKKRHISESQFVLEEGNEITDSFELEKWSGNADFTSNDVGYYYMVYYWRLNDGRYLTDKKLVKIKSESHTFEIITGIINEEHTVWDTSSNDGFKAPIDQYVTDDITVSDDGDTWDKDYPSKDSGFSSDNVESYYDDYNKTAVYGGDTYYIKSSRILSTSVNSVMGWHRTTDYRLTTLIVEVQTPDGTWVEMARIDSNSPTFDFSNATYQYQFSGYTVNQDTETKLFTVTETSSAKQSFEVKNGSTASGIENFIEFNFENGGNTENISYDSSDSIRVTALFRQNKADIQMEKFVLTGTDDDNQTNESDNVLSLQKQDEAYEVDNTDITNNNERKAVLSGDTLTYRMKLYNAGYFDSDTVNVYDEIPDGCEYVDGTMKIYKQKKDLTSGTVVYDEYKDVTDSENYSSVFNGGSLHWQIPTIELYYDYYVEYKVKVNQLGAAEQSRLLTNTAQWDFIVLNGDLNTNSNVDDGDTSIDSYKQYTIFEMNVSQNDEDNYETYEITFKQQDTTTEYDNIRFENELPDGFIFKEDSDIELIKIESDGSENLISDATINKNTDNNTFVISGFDLKPGDKYLVRFTGIVPEVTYEKEIKNKSSIIYEKTDSGKTQALGNSITKITRLSNQVETDVEHLYFKVEKTTENYDPSQTFLFKIERYASENAKANGAEAKDIYYIQINCTEKQNDGTYKGTQLIQVDKRGYYAVTEITDWSATDYEFESTSSADVQTSGYSAEVQKNGEISQSGQMVEFSLPRLIYSSGAFPTSLGMPSSYSCLTASFVNNESDYAYLSGQAYAENTILKSDSA